MTNPTSYTEEQVRDALEWGELSPYDISDVARYLFADRQRLQAEVEALRNGAKRLASNWVRHSASGASHSPWVHEDCAEQLRDLLTLTRATPNETKEAKS